MTIWQYVIDFIFPRSCPACGRPVNWGHCWCTSCLEEVIQPRYLLHEYDNSPLETVYTLGKYDRGLRKIIHHIKFTGQKADAIAAQPFLENLHLWLKEEEIDCVVPVPVSEEKLKKRGYNQVDVLFQDFFKSIAMPYNAVIGKKNGDQAMWQMSKEERQKHTEALFYSKDDAQTRAYCEGKTVLIIDDIYTTGATIEAMAQTLRPFSCKKIKALTLASGA